MSNGRGGGSRGGGGLSEYLTLPQYPALTELLQTTQQQANLGRIPGAAGLEAQSSLDIAGLLNPPALFPDTSRMAAEAAAGRGVAGSPAGYSTAVRMTDEERLRRIALGQNMLSAAYQRNPAAPMINPLELGITPYQRQYLDLHRGGGLRAGGVYPGGGMPSLGGPARSPFAPAPGGQPIDYSPLFRDGGGGGLTPWTPPQISPSPDQDLLQMNPYGYTGGPDYGYPPWEGPPQYPPFEGPLPELPQLPPIAGGDEGFYEGM